MLRVCAGPSTTNGIHRWLQSSSPTDIRQRTCCGSSCATTVNLLLNSPRARQQTTETAQVDGRARARVGGEEVVGGCGEGSRHRYGPLQRGGLVQSLQRVGVGSLLQFRRPGLCAFV